MRRLNLAVDRGLLPDHVSVVTVGHDQGCPTMSHDATCTCDPQITVTVERQGQYVRFEVLADGSVSELH